MLALATIAFGFCSCEDVPMPYGYPQGSTDPTNPDLPAEGEGTLESPYNVAAANAGTESGEIFAAIAMAIHELNDEHHDFESSILTIKKAQRNYSPWNSKVLSLRQNPVIKK